MIPSFLNFHQRSVHFCFNLWLMIEFLTLERYQWYVRNVLNENFYLKFKEKNSDNKKKLFVQSICFLWRNVCTTVVMVYSFDIHDSLFFCSNNLIILLFIFEIFSFIIERLSVIFNIWSLIFAICSLFFAICSLIFIMLSWWALKWRAFFELRCLIWTKTCFGCFFFDDWWGIFRTF